MHNVVNLLLVFVPTQLCMRIHHTHLVLCRCIRCRLAFVCFFSSLNIGFLNFKYICSFKFAAATTISNCQRRLSELKGVFDVSYVGNTFSNRIRSQFLVERVFFAWDFEFLPVFMEF